MMYHGDTPTRRRAQAGKEYLINPFAVPAIIAEGVAGQPNSEELFQARLALVSEVRGWGLEVTAPSRPRQAGRPRSRTAASDHALKEMAAEIIVKNPDASLKFVAFTIASRLGLKQNTATRYLTRVLKGTGFREFRNTVARRQKIIEEVLE
jgi:hypothetical protein